MNINKLFTHEDKFNIHKILGMICLSNFAYQFYNLYMYRTVILNINNINLLLFHTLLSTSSLIFKISSSRHNKLPIIYPELRLHSIIFALRSIICCFDISLLYKMLTCFITMILADIVTHFLKKGTTIRSLPSSEFMNDEDRSKLKYHYSRSQISATMFMLGNQTTSFLTLLPIQTAPLLMTLVKKNIIHPHYFYVFYTLSLWLNSFSYFSSTPGWLIVHIICINIASFLRFENKVNKYLTWSIVFIIYIMLEGYIEMLDSYLPTKKHKDMFIGVLIGFYYLKNLITHTSLFSKRYQ